jgi:hypothetical protein
VTETCAVCVPPGAITRIAGWADSEKSGGYPVCVGGDPDEAAPPQEESKQQIAATETLIDSAWRILKLRCPERLRLVRRSILLDILRMSGRNITPRASTCTSQIPSHDGDDPAHPRKRREDGAPLCLLLTARSNQRKVGHPPTSAPFLETQRSEIIASSARTGGRRAWNRRALPDSCLGTDPLLCKGLV